MPVASRTLKYVRPLPNGRVRVREVIISNMGKKIIHTYEAVSEVQAISDMNSRVVIENFKADDFNDVLNWVKARNTIASFDFTNRDIIETDAEEFVLIHFAEAFGAEAIPFAWWLDSLGTIAVDIIRDRIPFTSEEGDIIASKCTSLLSSEPWFDTIIKAPG